MKTTILLAAGTLLVATTPAWAGGLNEPVMTPAPAPVAVAPAPAPVGNDWTGFYAGAGVGFARLDAPSFADDTEGGTYGVHAGYLYDLGNFVVGAELEYDVADITDAPTGITLDNVARAKLRAGYDAGRLLPYLTVGGAQAYTSGALEADDSGVFAGLGLDYQVNDNIRVGAEVLQHRFDDFNDTGTDIEATTAALRVAYRF